MAKPGRTVRNIRRRKLQQALQKIPSLQKRIAAQRTLVGRYDTQARQPYEPPKFDPRQAEDPQSQLESGEAQRRWEEGESQLTLAGSRNQEDYERAGKLSAEQETEELGGTKREQAQRGLLFSGVLTKSLGDVRKRYAESGTTREIAFKRAQYDIGEQRKLLSTAKDEAFARIKLNAQQRAEQRAAEAALNAPVTKGLTPAERQARDKAAARAQLLGKRLKFQQKRKQKFGRR